MRLCMFVLLAASVYAADPREEQICAAQASFWNCWSSADTACLSKLVTDDFVQISGTGKRRDKVEFLAGMKAGTFSKGTPPAAALSAASVAPDLRIRFFGNTAVATWQSARRNEIGTYVWVASDGRSWRMANQQITILPPPAPTLPSPKTLVGTWKLNLDRSRMGEGSGLVIRPQTMKKFLTPDHFIAEEVQRVDREEPSRRTCDGSPLTTNGVTVRCETVNDRFLRLNWVGGDGFRFEATEEVSADGATLFLVRKRFNADGSISGYATAVYDRID